MNFSFCIKSHSFLCDLYVYIHTKENHMFFFFSDKLTIVTKKFLLRMYVTLNEGRIIRTGDNLKDDQSLLC